MSETTTLPDEAEALTLALEAIRKAVRENPAVWIELHGAIRDKSGAVVPPGEVRVNIYQQRIALVIVWCLAHEVPIRILGLKPRQKGSSTFFVACCYWFLSMMRGRGCMIGGAHSQGDNLFKMLKLYAERDTFDPRNRCRVVDRRANWPSGSECVQETAANPEAGRSGTFQVVIATEAARWSREGVANAADVLAGLLKCVPQLPRTMIGLESTADGATGDFYDRWQQAITFEELQAGKRGFVKVFAAWFEFADSVIDARAADGGASSEGILSEADYTDRERDLAAEFGLTMAQVAWMRWAIREECKGDFDTFREDYPFDAETAFLTSGRRRFNGGMLRKQVLRLPMFPPQFGVIAEGTRAVWTPCDAGEAQVLRWEQPRAGCRYLLAVDLMTGATQVGGKDPDNHAPLVIRAGFWQEGGGWAPPRVVARIVNDWREWERRRKYELWWDIDVLERKVWALAQYYGNCCIVPEMNKDRGLVELLKLRGTARIFRRPIFNRREQKEMDALGWETTEKTREIAVETLARAIREHGTDGDGVDIPCPVTLAECEAFVVNEKGRSEAMSGKHDDNVMALAIGLTCINAATVYVEPVRTQTLPRDLERLLRREGVGDGKRMGHRW